MICFFNFFLKIYFLMFLASLENMLIDFKERGRERERERNSDDQFVASCMHPPNGNQTHDPSFHRTMLKPTEPYQPGPIFREKERKRERNCFVVPLICAFIG